MTEPLFRSIGGEDNYMQVAHAKALSTIADFVSLVKLNKHSFTMAKLRFKDPDLSAELGQDQFLYLWLNDIVYHDQDRLLSGVFFELPKELEKWHYIGQRLGFEPEDVFDWCAIENGHAKGGFTLRATREKLKSEQEKMEFDEYTGISSYE